MLEPTAGTGDDATGVRETPGPGSGRAATGAGVCFTAGLPLRGSNAGRGIMSSSLIGGALIAVAPSLSSAASAAANSGCGSGWGRRWRPESWLGIGGGSVRGRDRPRMPRKWLTFSTGSQSSKPSLQQYSSSPLPRPATHAWACASENGPDCVPSIETYHSSSSAAGAGATLMPGDELIALANAASSGRPAAGVGNESRRLRAATPPELGPRTSAGASSMPSRTVMTFAQFLQRILRILPRTRSSAIE